MKLSQFINDAKVIDIKSKLKKKKSSEHEKLSDISTISGNMINALSFVIEETRKGKNLKKIKNMLDRIIKELRFIRDNI